MSRSEDALDENPDELRKLRDDFMGRIEVQPFENWSGALLRALIAVFDVAGVVPSSPVVEPVVRPRLSVVR